MSIFKNLVDFWEKKIKFRQFFGGGVQIFKYYDTDFESLPLTCRCGKTHLGDNSICTHIKIRNKIERI